MIGGIIGFCGRIIALLFIVVRIVGAVRAGFWSLGGFLCLCLRIISCLLGLWTVVVDFSFVKILIVRGIQGGFGLWERLCFYCYLYGLSFY